MASIDEALAVAEANVPICIIDPDTRVISVPSEYKNFGVESDEKVTRVHFQCPKIVGDNIDLTEFNLYINYRNANGELNIYLIDDMSSSGDNVVFSWLLSRHVTAYTGNVDYIVCAKKSDGASITNEWNTKIATGTVSGGLEATKEIEEQNADVIEQILKRLDNDYITQSELQAATDKALAQAKASGEFDGADGAPGKDGTSATHSWNGTVLTITSASGTSSADLKGEKVIRETPALKAQKVIREIPGIPALRDHRVRREKQEQPGRKAPKENPAKTEGLPSSIPLLSAKPSRYLR